MLSGDGERISPLEFNMTLSIYDFTVPTLTHALTQLSRQLEKANAHAARKKYDFKALADSRLIFDMHTLTRQIQTACDVAKGVYRLAGLEPPSHPDEEQTYEDLQARIAKALDVLASLKPEQFDGAESRDVVLKFPSITLQFKGQDYVTKFLLPNFYFHVTMAYALMRKNGVDLGKLDFLGPLQ